MKKLLWSLVACLMMVQVYASNPQWLVDFNRAKAYAKQYNRPILLNFTGSDWCPPCMKLDKEVYSTQEFLDYAKANLVLVKVDFPRKKPQAEALKRSNEALSNRYGIDGYPTMVLVDSDGKELGRKVSYGGVGPQGWIGMIEGFKRK